MKSRIGGDSLKHCLFVMAPSLLPSSGANKTRVAKRELEASEERGLLKNCWGKA